MRFIAAVLAMMALFAGVNAAKVDLGQFNLNEDGTVSSFSKDPTVAFSSVPVASVKPEGDNSVHRAMNALATTVEPAPASNVLTGDVWTKIYVGGSFNSWIFDSIYIKVAIPNTNPVQYTPDNDGDYYANFYGSQTNIASIPANTVPAELTILSKADPSVGQNRLFATGSKIFLQYQGSNANHFWPKEAGSGPSALRFEYLYVQILGSTDPKRRGDVAITLAADDGGNGCTTGACGDPQFVGLQGQDFQFHGMADEVFNLVSSPELQLNSLFKFISSGKCDYNDTMCWSHPGTYLGQIGLQFGADKILLQSGAHSEGMKVFINDKEVSPSKHIHQFAAAQNITSIAQYRASNKFSFNSDRFFINVVNSDYFFNLEFGLKDTQALLAGAKSMRVTGEICERESRMHKSLLTETKAQITAKLASTYPAYPLHGLVGQTWRNAEFCGRYYEGTVDDYVTGSLFGGEHTFNYFTASA